MKSGVRSMVTIQQCDMNKILATSRTCGPCHALKNKIQKLGLEVEIREYTPDTMEWFVKHNIKSVPRLVIEDGKNVEIIEGSEDILNALKNEERSI